MGGGGDGSGVDLARRKTRRYIEGLTLSGGDLDGEPFRVLPWERRFLRGALGPGSRPPHLGRSGQRQERAGGGDRVGGGGSRGAVARAPARGRLRGSELRAKRGSSSRTCSRFSEGRYDLDDRRRWRKANTANRALLEWRKTGAQGPCIGSDPVHGARAPAVPGFGGRARAVRRGEGGPDARGDPYGVSGRFRAPGWWRSGRGPRRTATGSPGCSRAARIIRRFTRPGRTIPRSSGGRGSARTRA